VPVEVMKGQTEWQKRHSYIVYNLRRRHYDEPEKRAMQQRERQRWAEEDARKRA
jgi:hypothetical protein